MTLLDEVFSPDLLDRMIAEGFVRQQVHPTEPLTILNYADKAQYERVWNEVTSACRGLIYNHLTMEVVARPFRKFFNLGEHEDDFDPHMMGPVRFFEKMDGSLGILYRRPSDGELAIATRGSFTSEQSAWATEWFRSNWPNFEPEPGATYLFEIIYPENRIVVDYGDDRHLVALAAIDTKTGQTIPNGHWNWPGEVVREHDYLDIATAIATERPNREGFVLHFTDSDMRVKIKHEEYVRLHRIVTGVTARTVWEILSKGESLNEVLERVPDEFYAWVKQTEDDLRAKVATLMFEWGRDFGECLKELNSRGFQGLLPTSPEWRREFASIAKTKPNPAALFAALDGKDIEGIAWKLVKPGADRPFRTTQEEA